MKADANTLQDEERERNKVKVRDYIRVEAQTRLLACVLTAHISEGIAVDREIFPAALSLPPPLTAVLHLDTLQTPPRLPLHTLYWDSFVSRQLWWLLRLAAELFPYCLSRIMEGGASLALNGNVFAASNKFLTRRINLHFSY